MSVKADGSQVDVIQQHVWNVSEPRKNFSASLKNLICCTSAKEAGHVLSAGCK
jgi:hypothetical protein